jgi:hypothetical protein
MKNPLIYGVVYQSDTTVIVSSYPKLISTIWESTALASPCSGLKPPIPYEYNIGQLLTVTFSTLKVIF